MPRELLTMKGEEKPRYVHKCCSCIYLGSCKFGEREVHDLYYCWTQLVVVRSNNPEDTFGHWLSVLRVSGVPDFRGFHPSLEVAYQRAAERKLI